MLGDFFLNFVFCFFNRLFLIVFYKSVGIIYYIPFHLPVLSVTPDLTFRQNIAITLLFQLKNVNFEALEEADTHCYLSSNDERIRQCKTFSKMYS